MNTDIAIRESTTLATRVSPMDALAMMSDQEFEQRLESLKLAQRRMKRIQRELMEENVDYGIIPGTGDKPTLLKPGTEKLCKMHHLVPTFGQETIMGDGISAPHFRVITTCSLRHESDDGPIVAQGMGAANSWEKKYRWRDAQRRCPSCGAAAIIKGKEEFGGGYICWAKKGGCGAKFPDGDESITGQQIGSVENSDPFDLENTIRKISAKRAQTDATLRATATSGLFSQDLEDMGDMAPTTNGPPSKPPAKPTARPQQNTKPAASIWPDIPLFANLGEFFKWCSVNYHLPQDKVLKELNVKNPMQIPDMMAAAATIRNVYGTPPAPVSAVVEDTEEAKND